MSIINNFPNGSTLQGINVSDTTLIAAYALDGYKFFNSNGELTEGTMPNNSSKSVYLNRSGESYTIPVGYQDGNSTVLANVSSTYGSDVDNTTLTAANAMSAYGEVFYNSSGTKTTGTMTVYPTSSTGDVEKQLTSSSTSYTLSKGNHGSGVFGYERIYFDWYYPDMITPTSSQKTISTSNNAFIGELLVDAAPNLNGGSCIMYELDSSTVTSDAVWFSGSSSIDIASLMPYIENAHIMIYATETFSRSGAIEQNYLAFAVKEFGSYDFEGYFVNGQEEYVESVYFSPEFTVSGTGIGVQLSSDPYLFEPNTNYHMICIITG